VAAVPFPFHGALDIYHIEVTRRRIPFMDINLREVTSSAVLEEKKKLRREFKYLDMIFYTVAALIGLDTIGAFAANGTQALTWLVISAITFLFPYALLIAELGSTFTQEGGMYEWCKMAGGASLPPWLLCCTGSPTPSGLVVR